MFQEKRGKRLFFYLNFVFVEVRLYDTSGITEQPLYSLVVNPLNHLFTLFANDVVIQDYESLKSPYRVYADVGIHHITLLREQNLNAYAQDFVFSVKVVVLKRTFRGYAKEYKGTLFSDFYITLDLAETQKIKVAAVFDKDFIDAVFTYFRPKNIMVDEVLEDLMM